MELAAQAGAGAALGLAGSLLAGTGGAGDDGVRSVQQARSRCFGKPATLVGTARANVLRGTRLADVIVGLGGNDAITGLAGNDLICGGDGTDKLDGGAGSDRLDGGVGSDTCRTGERLVRCEETRPNAAPGVLRAGPYVTDAFRPRFGFVVGDGWSVVFAVPRQLLLSQRRDPGGPSLTFDSFAGRQSVASTIARFAGISGVEAGTPSVAAIGGAEVGRSSCA